MPFGICICVLQWYLVYIDHEEPDRTELHFQAIQIGTCTLYVLCKMSISGLTVIHRQLLKRHSKLHYATLQSYIIFETEQKSISYENNLHCIMITSRNQLRVMKTPLHPTFSKTGVYRGMHYFLIFALKHRLWVLVRTTSLRRF